MTRISDFDKQNFQLTEMTKKRLQNKLNGLRRLHRDYEKEIEQGHQQEVLELKNKNRIQIAKENQRKERALDEMKQVLKRSQNMTENELTQLKEFSSIQKNEIQKRLNNDRSEIRNRHQDEIENINRRFNITAKDIQERGNLRLQNIHESMQSEINETNRKYGKKLEENRNSFHREAQNDRHTYQKLKNKQDQMFASERRLAHVRHRGHITRINDQQVDHLKQMNQEYRKDLKKQDEFFEQKFQDQYDHYNKSFAKIENRNLEIVNHLKESLAKEISQVALKSEEPFYQFDKLEPEVEELKDHVEIKVKIPPYAKKNLQLSLNGKKAIINFNRRYHDAHREDDGTINKINKVESFSTTVGVSRLLDPKSVKTSYDDDQKILKFVVNYS